MLRIHWSLNTLIRTKPGLVLILIYLLFLSNHSVIWVSLYFTKILVHSKIKNIEMPTPSSQILWEGLHRYMQWLLNSTVSRFQEQIKNSRVVITKLNNSSKSKHMWCYWDWSGHLEFQFLLLIILLHSVHNPHSNSK